MKPIQIAVTVPLKVAIAAGRAEYGDAAVTLDATTIQRLSPAALALVLDAEEHPTSGQLYVDKKTVSGRVTPWAEIKKKNLTGEQQKLVRELVNGAEPLTVTEPSAAAAVEALEALAIQRESSNREKAAQQLAVQAELEAAREAAVAYARYSGVADLEQAAEEDYDVAGAVSKHAMETIVLAAVRSWRLTYMDPPPRKPATRHSFGSDEMTVLAQVVEGDAAFVEMELQERPAPCARSFVVQENLTELAERVAPKLPKGWTLEVSRIMRYRSRLKRRCDCGKGCPKCAAHTVVTLALHSVLTHTRLLVIEAE